MSTVAASFTQSTGASNFAGFSVRSPVTLSAGLSAQRVRVTFAASTSSGLIADHCAIGIQSSGISTVATPVELKFSGVSGFSITASGSITSDWVSLDTTNGAIAVIIVDVNATGTDTAAYASSGLGSQSKTASATYNVASPTGFASTTVNSLFVTEVDVALAYSLSLSVGAYVLTGITAFLGKLFILNAVTGSYTLTGIATHMLKSLRLLGAVGSYALTGSAGQLKRGLHLLATVGSYAVTGSSAQLKRGLRLLAGVGSYTLTGIGLLVIEVIAPVTKFALRRANFVLQKLRQTEPTLDD